MICVTPEYLVKQSTVSKSRKNSGVGPPFVQVDKRGQSENNFEMILSRASKAGSPTNRSGSDKSWGQGSFGLSTGGPDLQGSLQPAELHVKHLTVDKLDNYLDKNFKKKRSAHLIRLFN